MKKIAEFFLSENFQFLVVKFSIYLNRRVFVMVSRDCGSKIHVNQGQMMRKGCKQRFYYVSTFTVIIF